MRVRGLKTKLTSENVHVGCLKRRIRNCISELSEQKENFLKYRYDLNFLMQKEKSEFKKSLEALFLAFAEFTVTKRLNLSAIEFLVKRTLPLDYCMT